jgi:hypothetical protein
VAQAQARYEDLVELDLSFGGSTLGILPITKLIETNLPRLSVLRLDLSFRMGPYRLDKRFWTALLRIESVQIIADNPDDVTDDDMDALKTTDTSNARWKRFHLSVRTANVTEYGVASLVVALRRCPSLTAL